MSQQTSQESGVLLVDKAAGWTSHDVVSFIRKFGFRKVGHCGTLDPGATGLLVIVIGRATKLSERFSKQDKTYAGTMTLGVDTFTQDAEGEVIQIRDWSHVSEQQVYSVCAEFVGPQDQVPPMVSAVKKDGKELYKLARQGIVVDRQPRPINIYDLNVISVELPDVAFSVKCSKGTYVRTLCADIGAKLECGAHLKSLRRLVSGRFSLDGAHSIEEIKNWNKEILFRNFMPLDAVLSYI